ncbi:MAG: hypothetical protein U5K55_07110 [Aliarcobacter sp.]|nr:hypothetical protein [Aliarcobacter sp.]
MNSYISIINLKKEFNHEDYINLHSTFNYKNSFHEKEILSFSNSNINNITSYQSQSNKLSFIFNGRIYNRNELYNYLNLNKKDLISDNELILQLYFKFGKNC